MSLLIEDPVPFVSDEVEGQVPAEVVGRDPGDDAATVGLPDAAAVGQRPVQVPGDGVRLTSVHHVGFQQLTKKQK